MANSPPPQQLPTPMEANVTDQVASIQIALEKNRVATERLHASWLSWLRTLAGIVVCLALVQAHGPLMQCMRDEAYAYSQGSAVNLSFPRNIVLAVQDGL
jgi:hypothetical protein